MLIVETRPFTRRILELLADDGYRELQTELCGRPDAGTVMPGSGGLRKVRWRGAGGGKRGGIRVVYYWHRESSTLVMLFVFSKNERSNLTQSQVAALRTLIAEEYP